MGPCECGGVDYDGEEIVGVGSGGHGEKECGSSSSPPAFPPFLKQKKKLTSQNKKSKKSTNRRTGNKFVIAMATTSCSWTNRRSALAHLTHKKHNIMSRAKLLLRSVIDKPSSSLTRCATASITANNAASSTPTGKIVLIGGPSSSHRSMPFKHIIRGQIMSTHHHDLHTTRVSSLPLRPQSTMTMTSATSLEDDDTDSNNGSSNDNNNNSTSTPFLLADIGEGITEVELLQWYIHPGDTVSQFDRICEVQSDKAAVEITSRFDGVVERLCGNVGDMMGVGRPLLYITTTTTTTTTSSSSSSSNSTASFSSTPPATVPAINNVEAKDDIPPVSTKYYPSHYSNNDSDKVGGGGTASEMDGSRRNENISIIASSAKVLTSPAVRKLIKENGIDLGRIQGSGTGGRVLKGDVLKMIDPTYDGNSYIIGRGDNNRMTASNSNNIHTTPTISNNAEPIPPPIIPKEKATSTTTVVVPIRGYNRSMVKSMTLSLQVPHMIYSDEINIDALTSVRDSLRPLATEMGITKKLSHMPFFIKATSLALLKYPIMNSTIDVENMTLTLHNEHRIGVAVDTVRGLTVPVIRKCQEKSVLEIALELNRLYSLAS